jgi:hypothetical protein
MPRTKTTRLAHFDEVASSAELLKQLHLLLPAANVFNPWNDHDNVNDGREDAARVRSEQLEAYLSARILTANLLLVAEAAGYDGAKFSGIPMTSERILLGLHKKVAAISVIPGAALQTSARKQYPHGRTEPTATLVWKEMLSHGFAANEFVLWNAFPCHPHRPGLSLTNRKPLVRELQASEHILPLILDMFPQAKVVAIGNVASGELQKLGLIPPEVRHPMNGGARLFADQLAAALSSAPPSRR